MVIYMKKRILFLLLLTAVLIVGLSGCLNNSDSNESDNNPVPENNTTPQPENPSGPASQIETFNGSIVTIDPLPSGFTHLATRSVTTTQTRIGISDTLIGYRNMMTYDDSNVYFAVYKCSGSKNAEEYVSEMISSHAAKYGSDSSVSTVTINGHSATLLEATVQETPQDGRYTLVWSDWTGDVYDDSYLIVVNGQVNYSVLKELAEASNL